jgi:hypothetical protein
MQAVELVVIHAVVHSAAAVAVTLTTASHCAAFRPLKKLATPERASAKPAAPCFSKVI